MEVIAAVGGQNVVGSLLFQVCADRFGAVSADKGGWCCVEQSQSPGWFVVNPT